MKLQLPKIKKISIRITLYFSFLLILIGLAITVMNISLYSDELSEEMDTVAKQKLNLVIGRLDENISNVKLIHTILLSDEKVKSAFTAANEDPNDVNIAVLANLLDNYASSGSNRQNIIALGTKGEIYNPISEFPAFQALTTDNEDFKLMQDQKQYQRFTTPNTFPLEYANPTLNQRTNITLYAEFYDYTTVTHLGYLAINFNKSDMLSKVTQLLNDTFESSYIVNEKGELIHQFGLVPYMDYVSTIKENEYFQKTGNLNNQLLIMGDSEYSIMENTLNSYERWKIITLFNTELIEIETGRLNTYIYLTLITALIIMMFISWLVSQNITNPIRTMVKSMDEFEKGQWPEPLETDNEDEIKDLIEGYNRMLTSFIKLTDNIIDREQTTKQIELDLLSSHINLLEAQINPHFIHNTLNSMNYLAISSNNMELSKLIESFNSLLRTSMAIDVRFVTVTEEINNLKAYISIQKVRFEDVFTVNYSVTPEASISKIPKLILQPIVENSIIHGILPKDSPCSINIDIQTIRKHLVLTIEDDGAGIVDEKLETLNRFDDSTAEKKRIGVQNVYDRLELFYGGDFTFTIESKWNVGTKTVITLPYED